ncbi:hypothetical protein MTO96_007931 [Rhipicephalus appendiculatus]
MPRGLSPLASLPPSSSSCLPASSLAAAGASAPPSVLAVFRGVRSPRGIPGPTPASRQNRASTLSSERASKCALPSSPHALLFSFLLACARQAGALLSFHVNAPQRPPPTSSAPSHHYPFSPPSLCHLLCGGVHGRLPSGRWLPESTAPSYTPRTCTFLRRIRSSPLRPLHPPPPAHQATAPQHHSKTPPLARPPYPCPSLLSFRWTAEAGEAGTGWPHLPTTGAPAATTVAGCRRITAAAAPTMVAPPVHHIVPEEEEEEPEAQQLVRGPSPEPKVEDSECHRSQSAIFLRHWSRGEFNSCARTDLTFKPVPDSKLARKREERARKAAEKEREEAKQRLSSLEHRSGASESKAGPSGHPCDFPPGANPYRTAPQRGAATNPYAAAAARLPPRQTPLRCGS